MSCALNSTIIEETGTLTPVTVTVRLGKRPQGSSSGLRVSVSQGTSLSTEYRRGFT